VAFNLSGLGFPFPAALLCSVLWSFLDRALQICRTVVLLAELEGNTRAHHFNFLKDLEPKVFAVVREGQNVMKQRRRRRRRE